MAANFQILSYKTRDSLHLKLNGDFDGTSAYELINTIKDNGTNFYQICIYIYYRNTVQAIVQHVLQKNFGDLNKLSNLIFIGENERYLAHN